MELTEQVLVPKYTSAIQFGLQTLVTSVAHNQANQAPAEGEAPAGEQVPEVPKVIDIFNRNPLPFIIGTRDFVEDEHAGLFYESEEDSAFETESSSLEFSESDEFQAGGDAPAAISEDEPTPSGSEGDSDEAQQRRRRNEDRRIRRRAREQAAAPAAPGGVYASSEEESDMFGSGEEKPRKSHANAMSRSASSDDLFGDNEKGSGTSESESGPRDFRDDLAAALGGGAPKKKKKHTRKRTEPSEPGGLFGDEAEGDLFGEDEAPRGSEKKKKTKAPKKEADLFGSGGDLFGEDEGDMFSAPKPKKQSQAESDLFGGIDDDEDGLFGSGMPSKAAQSVFGEEEEEESAPAKRSSSSVKKSSGGGLFGDDEDLFDEPAATSSRSSRATEEDDLFGEPKAEPKKRPAGAVAIPGLADIAKKAPAKESKSAFGDDEADDLFSAPAAVKKEPTKKSGGGGLFGDDEDDLFASSSSASKKETAPVESVAEERKRPAGAVAMPGMADMLRKKQPQEESAKPEPKSQSLFGGGDEDDLFGAPKAASKPATAKPAAKSTGLFGDGDDDLFGPAKKSEPSAADDLFGASAKKTEAKLTGAAEDDPFASVAKAEAPAAAAEEPAAKKKPAGAVAMPGMADMIKKAPKTDKPKSVFGSSADDDLFGPPASKPKEEAKKEPAKSTSASLFGGGDDDLFGAPAKKPEQPKPETKKQEDDEVFGRPKRDPHKGSDLFGGGDDDLFAAPAPKKETPKKEEPKKEAASSKSSGADDLFGAPATKSSGSSKSADDDLFGPPPTAAKKVTFDGLFDAPPSEPEKPAPTQEVAKVEKVSHAKKAGGLFGGDDDDPFSDKPAAKKPEAANDDPLASLLAPAPEAKKAPAPKPAAAAVDDLFGEPAAAPPAAKKSTGKKTTTTKKTSTTNKTPVKTSSVPDLFDEAPAAVPKKTGKKKTSKTAKKESTSTKTAPKPTAAVDDLFGPPVPKSAPSAEDDLFGAPSAAAKEPATKTAKKVTTPAKTAANDDDLFGPPATKAAVAAVDDLFGPPAATPTAAAKPKEDDLFAGAPKAAAAKKDTDDLFGGPKPAAAKKTDADDLFGPPASNAAMPKDPDDDLFSTPKPADKAGLKPVTASLLNKAIADLGEEDPATQPPAPATEEKKKPAGAVAMPGMAELFAKRETTKEEPKPKPKSMDEDLFGPAFAVKTAAKATPAQINDDDLFGPRKPAEPKPVSPAASPAPAPAAPKSIFERTLDDPDDDLPLPLSAPERKEEKKDEEEAQEAPAKKPPAGAVAMPGMALFGAGGPGVVKSSAKSGGKIAALQSGLKFNPMMMGGGGPPGIKVKSDDVIVAEGGTVEPKASRLDGITTDTAPKPSKKLTHVTKGRARRTKTHASDGAAPGSAAPAAAPAGAPTPSPSPAPAKQQDVFGKSSGWNQKVSNDDLFASKPKPASNPLGDDLFTTKPKPSSPAAKPSEDPFSTPAPASSPAPAAAKPLATPDSLSLFGTPSQKSFLDGDDDIFGAPAAGTPKKAARKDLDIFGSSPADSLFAAAAKPKASTPKAAAAPDDIFGDPTKKPDAPAPDIFNPF